MVKLHGFFLSDCFRASFCLLKYSLLLLLMLVWQTFVVIQGVWNQHVRLWALSFGPYEGQAKVGYVEISGCREACNTMFTHFWSKDLEQSIWMFNFELLCQYDQYLAVPYAYLNYYLYLADFISSITLFLYFQPGRFLNIGVTGTKFKLLNHINNSRWISWMSKLLSCGSYVTLLGRLQHWVWR